MIGSENNAGVGCGKVVKSTLGEASTFVMRQTSRPYALRITDYELGSTHQNGERFVEIH